MSYAPAWPIHVGQSCVNCHNCDRPPNSPRRDWKLGDVRGVLEVATVIDPQIAHGTQISHLIVLCAIIAEFCCRR